MHRRTKSSRQIDLPQRSGVHEVHISDLERGVPIGDVSKGTKVSGPRGNPMRPGCGLRGFETRSAVSCCPHSSSGGVDLEEALSEI